VNGEQVVVKLFGGKLIIWEGVLGPQAKGGRHTGDDCDFVSVDQGVGAGEESVLLSLKVPVSNVKNFLFAQYMY
jgi:hypothetical protein